MLSPRRFLFQSLIFLGCKPVSPASSENLSQEKIISFEREGFASHEDQTEYTECKKLGFIFNRLETPYQGKCTQIPVAKSYQCTPIKIHDKFSSIGVDVPLISINGEHKLADFPDYDIDQCGEIGMDPIIILIRKFIDDGTDSTIEVKHLCRKGSPLCFN